MTSLTINKTIHILYCCLHYSNAETAVPYKYVTQCTHSVPQMSMGVCACMTGICLVMSDGSGGEHISARHCDKSILLYNQRLNICKHSSVHLHAYDRL